MNVLEKEIEELIWNAINLQPDLLQKKGLRLPHDGIFFRQPYLGNYGRADIVGLDIYPKVNGDRPIAIHIYELKKEFIDASAFFQALDYAKGVSKLLEQLFNNVHFYYFFHLVGKKCDYKSSLIYLPDVFSNICLYEYQIDFTQGIVFKNINHFSLVNPDFGNCEPMKQAIKEKFKSKFQSLIEQNGMPF